MMALASCNTQHSDAKMTNSKPTSNAAHTPAVDVLGIWSVRSVTDQGHILPMDDPRVDLRFWFQRASPNIALTVLYGTEGCPIVGGYVSQTGSRFSFTEVAENAALSCVSPPPEFGTRLRSALLAGFTVQQSNDDLRVRSAAFLLTVQKRTASRH